MQTGRHLRPTCSSLRDLEARTALNDARSSVIRSPVYRYTPCRVLTQPATRKGLELVAPRWRKVDGSRPAATGMDRETNELSKQMSKYRTQSEKDAVPPSEDWNFTRASRSLSPRNEISEPSSSVCVDRVPFAPSRVQASDCSPTKRASVLL
jgi:hypothetical protein